MPTGQRKFAREDGRYADFLDTNTGALQAPGTAFIGSSNLAAPSDHIHPLASGGLTLIASKVNAAPATTITFSSIPQTFSVLRLLAFGASAYAIESDRWYLTVGPTTGYDLQEVAGSSSSAVAAAKSNQGGWNVNNSPTGDIPGASATAGVAGILDVTIPGYALTTFQKVGTWRSGYSDALTAAGDQQIHDAVISVRSTAAITSMQISLVSAGNLITGSAAYLYGS